VLQALGTIWFRFLQKKSKKKFDACVSLSNIMSSESVLSCLLVMPGLGWREPTMPTSHHNPAQETGI
jgi:hypothetical protein